MPCCTDKPKNLDPEEKAKRDEAIQLVESCLKQVKDLGYFIHTCYSHQNNFFIEKN
jgi:hypothetical protein